MHRSRAHQADAPSRKHPPATPAARSPISSTPTTSPASSSVRRALSAASSPASPAPNSLPRRGGIISVRCDVAPWPKGAILLLASVNVMLTRVCEDRCLVRVSLGAPGAHRAQVEGARGNHLVLERALGDAGEGYVVSLPLRRHRGADETLKDGVSRRKATPTSPARTPSRIPSRATSPSPTCATSTSRWSPTILAASPCPRCTTRSRRRS